MARKRLLVLTLAAFIPATAAAAPIPGASYGGGVPPKSFKTRGIVKSVQLDAHITADGTRARIRGTMSVPCLGGTLGQRFDASGPVDATGRVVAQARSLRYTGPAVITTRPRGLASVNILFEGARASGTVRVRATVRNRRNKRVRCDTGDVPVQLRSVTADPGTPGAPAAGGLYFGNAESLWRGRVTPVTVRVNAAGTRITGFLFGATLRCGGKDEYMANISPPMTIRADGTFRKTEKFSAKFKNAVDRTTVLVKGRFTAQGITGTVNAVQRTRFKNGQRSACRTGTIRWHAVL